MRDRFNSWVLILAASSLLAGGCRSTRPTEASLDAADTNRPPETKILSDDTSSESLAEAHARYATAVIQELNGDADGALKEYYAAALEDLDNESLLLEVSRRLLQAKQPEKALELLKRTTARPNAAGTLYAQLGIIYSRLGKTD